MKNKKKKEGKVILVGAGPGDEKLITLKGIDAIRQADILFYDRLINKTILKYAPTGTKLIYCGKKEGSKLNRQNEISSLLLKEAKKGKTVIRLKGGDPYMFGRGAEETEYLIRKGVAVEVIPGVTSAIAVPESAGIPVTHRKYSSSLIITAGKCSDGKTASLVREAQILKRRGSTLVILMAVSGLKAITASLIKNGVSKSTPAVLIQDGTLAHQRIAEGNVGSIAGISEKMKISSPAILVAGNVVRFRKKVFPTEKPLTGKTVLVTRSEKKDGRLSSLIQESGGKAITIPLINIKERNISRIRQSIVKEIKKTEWLVFTSIRGAEIFMKKIIGRGKDILPQNVKICAIGEATAEFLKGEGLKVHFIPTEYSSQGILKGFKKRKIAGKKIFIFRSSIGTSMLPQTLKGFGANVTDYPLYDIKEAVENRSILKNKLEGGIDITTFTSSSAVKSFIKLAGKKNLKKIKERILFAVIGDVTEKELERYGLKANIKPSKFTIPAMVKAMNDYYFRKE